MAEFGGQTDKGKGISESISSSETERSSPLGTIIAQRRLKIGAERQTVGLLGAVFILMASELRNSAEVPELVPQAPLIFSLSAVLVSEVEAWILMFRPSKYQKTSCDIQRPLDELIPEAWPRELFG